MPNLTLAFAELLGGGVLLVAGATGTSVPDTIRGNVTMHPLDAGRAGGAPAAAGGGSVPASSTGGQAAAPTIKAAAAKWGIPADILWGVYGSETSFGSDVTTSSAGAEGPFQFIQSTAASYHYPYTNATDPSTFAAQADAAAHYLSDLVKQHGGSWDAALTAYSGGGYGLAHVQAEASGNPLP